MQQVHLTGIVLRAERRSVDAERLACREFHGLDQPLQHLRSRIGLAEN
jgi:hypothetical protein